jgi:hypothetical protein
LQQRLRKFSGYEKSKLTKKKKVSKEVWEALVEGSSILSLLFVG